MPARDADAAQTVGAVGERALIARLGRAVGPAPPGIVVGLGDDAAVIEPPRGELDVLSTDSLVEDVHFRLAWTPPAAIGHKALAVNLSDLAAMGATPRACLLALALPADLPVVAFDAIVEGLVGLAAATDAPLIGGNVTRSPGPLTLDVTVLGSVGRRAVLRRSGARPGDRLYVTGSLGGAAAGLAMLAAGVDRATLDAQRAACVARYERPEPRLRCGRILARQRAVSAAIDLSDGLADGARQLADASGTGVTLDLERVPVHPGATTHAARTGVDARLGAVEAGEDYELLVAVPPRRQRAFEGASHRFRDVAVTEVGQLTAETGHWLTEAGSRRPLGQGFDHFIR